MSSNDPLVVLSSRNRKKSGEIAELLAPHSVRLVSVAEFPNIPDVVEDGRTFAENAAKKAAEVARQLKTWTIGEDSGLMVDALNGAPGIYSARYSALETGGLGAPPEKNNADENNNARLLRELAQVPPEKRTAAYLCSVALSDPEGNIRAVAEERCRGIIISQARGANGFGYDPYFLIPEYHLTFGELDSSVKQQISHRARAFRKFIPQLIRLVREEN